MDVMLAERLRRYTEEREDPTRLRGADADRRREGGEHTIKPYWLDGAWMFDDPLRGLLAKPLVERRPEAIDHVLQLAGLQPRQPFTLTFGDREFSRPGYRFVLEWVREDREGQWYRWNATDGLCPALVRYFDGAPKRIYCVVAARRTPFWVHGVDRPAVTLPALQSTR